MTTPPPRPPIQAKPAVSARPGGLSRLKLTEPARLHGYTILAALALVLVAAGLLTGEMGHALTGLAAAVLGIVPAVESIRGSVYSTAGHVQGILRAGRTWGVQEVGHQ
jgi:hypothetical protein